MRLWAFLRVAVRLWAFLNVSARLWMSLGVSVFLCVSVCLWTSLGVSAKRFCGPWESLSFLDIYERFCASLVISVRLWASLRVSMLSVSVSLRASLAFLGVSGRFHTFLCVSGRVREACRGKAVL